MELLHATHPRSLQRSEVPAASPDRVRRKVNRGYLLSFLPPGLDPRQPDAMGAFRAGMPTQYAGNGKFRELEWSKPKA